MPSGYFHGTGPGQYPRDGDGNPHRLATVLEAEARVADLQSSAEKAGDPEELNRIYAELNDAQSEVERLYERWAELDEMS